MNEKENKMFLDNIKLIGAIIKNYKYNYEDLFQVGCIGLIKAIKRFDESRNVKFSTYAYITIKGEILVFIRSNSKVDTVSIDDMLDTENEIENKLNKIDLINSIKKLSKSEQQVIILYFFKEKTQKEIGESLHFTQQSAGIKLKSALYHLREMYKVGV